MIKQNYSNIDVVTAAKIRIKNIFNSANKVYLGISGGKDSICLNDVIYKLCLSGEIDKSKLTIDFIDEEAIYPCIERIVKNMRLQWISLGVEFRWWCIQVKHYCCFNQLSNDESFICWDETKKDVWIRNKPAFALTSDPLLKERTDTYQDFLKRKEKDGVVLLGVRVAESVQRRYNIASSNDEGRQFPIYDWADLDIWNYIANENLDFPDAYRYLYQVGTPMGQMRISQFFSIDTARSLVKMCEFYPNLFDKICKREPNAYMAMLYYDTELFRRDKEKKKTGEKDDTDYKAKLLELLKEDWRFDSAQGKKLLKQVKHILMSYSISLNQKEYKKLCETVIAGDPKGRELRAIQISMMSRMSKE